MGLAVILLGLLLLFIMPSLKSGPRDLPLGVVADEATTKALTEALQSQAPGAYDLRSMDSPAALDAAVRDRALHGGFDLSQPGTLRITVASAGSTAISGTVTATGTQLATAQQREPVVHDVVALPAEDPIGAGIGGLAFPLVFGGIVPAVAFRSLLPGHRFLVLAGLISFSLVGGFVVAAVLRYVFGSIEHSLWPVTGAVALGIAALAVPLSALNDAFGPKGFTIAAMTMMFVGNPFAGIATSAVWLPAGVAAVGQLLPPGAAGTLVRSVAYFGGAGGTPSALTLAAWVAVGLALYLVAPKLRGEGQSPARA